jgi:hypothetical protein
MDQNIPAAQQQDAIRKDPAPSHEESLARMTESPEARQAREYDAWETSEAGMAAQEREIARWSAKNRPAWEKGADLDHSR